MELRHLRYFVAVAEERHFGRAAERLHMAQPPLSQQIRQLERELGLELLTRTTRRVDLTAAGAAYLARAREILRAVDDDVARHRSRQHLDGGGGQRFSASAFRTVLCQ
jgi:DNA-binding transcriptional LysR family regulator